MGFYATNFIYDSIISSEYGLRISSIEEDMQLGADVILHTQEMYRRPRPYLLGVQQSPVLSMLINISAEEEISAVEDSIISSWLFGSLSYKKLRIIQPDMSNIYYNCIFTGKTTIRYGNIIRGYQATVLCDSPFAWENERTITKTYNPLNYVTQDRIIINNTSDNADYTYPTVSFTMTRHGGDVSITNRKDNNRRFLFKRLSALETITVNNDLQTITSSLGVNRFPNFTNSTTSIYNWLRYVKKENILILRGAVSEISFTHQFARKVS